MKLGKLPKVDDARNLKLARYLNPARLPPLPLSRSWSAAVSRWPMLANDRVGCCTCTAAGHAILTWTANNDGPTVVPTEQDVLNAYAAVSGYDGTPETDRGASMLAVLKYWRSVGIGGHKILAFAEIDTRDHVTMQRALDLFGGVYLGLRLPTTAQQERIWARTDGKPSSWGNHAVWMPDRDFHTRRVATWSRDQDATPEWIETFADEAYAPVSSDWLGPDLVAPNGLRLDELLADLAIVTA